MLKELFVDSILPEQKRDIILKVIEDRKEDPDHFSLSVPEYEIIFEAMDRWRDLSKATTISDPYEVKILGFNPRIDQNNIKPSLLVEWKTSKQVRVDIIPMSILCLAAECLGYLRGFDIESGMIEATDGPKTDFTYWFYGEMLSSKERENIIKKAIYITYLK